MDGGDAGRDVELTDGSMESILSDTLLRYQRLDDLQEVREELDGGGDHQVVDEDMVAVGGHHGGRKTRTGQKMVSCSDWGWAMTAEDR